MENGMEILAIAAVSYLVGSIPFGLILTRKFSSVDILRQGSGNIGATNVRRLAGNRLGILTLLGDTLKGFVVGFLAGLTLPSGGGMSRDLIVCLAGICAFVGHLFPIYLKFKQGGKGVATAAGAFLAVSAPAALAAAGGFACLVVWTRRVSLGSIGAASILPVAAWHASHSPVVTLCALLLMVMIWVRHKENIRRLILGTEPKI
jgi:glycerol-3-phosphate acyltransferase PlsY